MISGKSFAECRGIHTELLGEGTRESFMRVEYELKCYIYNTPITRTQGMGCRSKPPASDIRAGRNQLLP